MAHKTLISGTAYSVTGGRELIGGTGYGCKAGKTLIGGTAFTVPFSKGIPLSTLTPGAILRINYVAGSGDIQFYIAKHDYESDLNGAGRTLLVTKYLSDYSAFGDSTSKNKYESGVLNKTMQNFLSRLDRSVQAEIEPTRFYFTPGGGDSTLTTMSAKIFSLSPTELGYKVNTSIVNAEGEALPIASLLQVGAYENGNTADFWTRTPSNYAGPGGATDYYACSANARKTATLIQYAARQNTRPAFTLPGTLALTQNPDGTYTLAA